MSRYKKERDRAAYELMHFLYIRYMLAVLRHDGAEKALRHRELMTSFLRIKGKRGDEGYALYEQIHRATQSLTDNLDTEVDLHNPNPDWDEMAYTFHRKFMEIASEALSDLTGENYD